MSEQEICKIVCSNPPACTCTDNCPVCFSIKSVGKAVEAQHKRDCEDFQKQKQEMWESIFVINGGSVIECIGIDTYEQLKRRWLSNE